MSNGIRIEDKIAEIMEVCEECCSDWEKDFVNSVSEQLGAFGDLSLKQKAVLNRIYGKVCDADESPRVTNPGAPARGRKLIAPKRSSVLPPPPGNSTSDISKIDIREFVEGGFLQEANRLFFHPLGLALEISISNDGAYSLSGVWDYRDNAEGVLFSEDSLLSREALEKASWIFDLKQAKVAVRKSLPSCDDKGIQKVLFDDDQVDEDEDDEDDNENIPF